MASPTDRFVPLILDGATGTELERRGVDIALPLWSARAIEAAPDVLREVHAEYLRSGADAITTATFRTHRRSLAREGRSSDAAALTRRAVAIACRARDETRPDALVFGSVAPLEECYRPESAPDAATCRREHEWQIADLVDGGVDVVLLETMNCLREARAAAEAAQSIAPGRWMLCVIGRAPGHLLSGEPVSALFDIVTDALAFGVNCIAAPATRDHVAWLAAERPPNVRVAAYANVGMADDDGAWISTDAVAPGRFAEHADTWIEAGATIVGGCCGTTPETIRAIRARLSR